MFGQSLALSNLRLGIFGDLVIDAMGGFGEKPKAPQAPYVDPQSAQRTAISGNMTMLPTLEDIARNVDAFNLAQRNKALTTAIPGYTGLTADASGTLGSWLRGEIPQDVASAVSRSSAAHAVSGGYGGSPMQDALEARNYGLTSLDLQKLGEGALPGFLNTVGRLGVPNEFDVTSGFLTPQQQIATEEQNQINRFQTDWLRNRLSAMPDPGTAAIAKDVGGIADIFGTALLSWAGGGLGGMIGGMGAGGLGGAAAGSSIGSQVGGQIGGGSPSGMSLGSIFQ